MTASSQSRIERKQIRDKALAWAAENPIRFPTAEQLADRLAAKEHNNPSEALALREFHAMLNERYRAAM